ncbi:ribosomal protein S21 [Leptospira interrogans serovar Copenhageni str. LT2050]|uniref:Small ribosomal subunit protein bS21 n=1 Tax=Leptospira interrogans serovar Copenhageni str. LT2050 TaxID=1001598 RepID=M3H4X6_LEPIT|nr:ribosomal protein S21 [Leptospira interrogans serovar Copenhageni str. LT2050]
MVGIIVKDGESIESALKRFKRDCANAGIMSEIKRREYFEKPSIKRESDRIRKRKAERKNVFSPKKTKPNFLTSSNLESIDSTYSNLKNLCPCR